MDLIFGLFLIFWLMPACIAGLIANGKGRSFIAYFCVSFFFTPVIGIIVALLINPDESVIAEDRLGNGEAKKCPYCAEIIKAEAKLCRYCGQPQST